MFVQDDVVIKYTLFVLPCPIILGFKRKLDSASTEHPFAEFQFQNYIGK